MRLLVVEDDQKIANALKRGLEQEAYAVDVAYHGDVGLDLALAEPYDAMVLDWMLPGQDGYSICQAVRLEGIATPILFLTAKDQVVDKVAGLNVGADDYLAKPFAFEELVARIQALLRRPQVLPSHQLKADEVVMDTVAREVRRGDERLTLTTKEYALLEYLLKHQGRVVSKDELMQHVWDFEADILPNTVEALVGALRRKIDRSPESSLIQTVRGYGYKIEKTA